MAIFCLLSVLSSLLGKGLDHKPVTLWQLTIAFLDFDLYFQKCHIFLPCLDVYSATNMQEKDILTVFIRGLLCGW